MEQAGAAERTQRGDARHAARRREHDHGHRDEAEEAAEEGDLEGMDAAVGRDADQQPLHRCHRRRRDHQQRRREGRPERRDHGRGSSSNIATDKVGSDKMVESRMMAELRST